MDEYGWVFPVTCNLMILGGIILRPGGFAPNIQDLPVGLVGHLGGLRSFNVYHLIYGSGRIMLYHVILMS